jgi:hypothetical protein
MRRTFAAAIGAISVAAMLSGAGLAAASTTAGAAPAAHGTEHFQIMTTSATASTNSIIATGLFTAGGVNHAGNTTDKAVFPGGTFKIKHSPGKGTQTLNPKTCLLTLNLHGTYTIGHGTGKYKGIGGHGNYQLSILAIGAKSGGKCSQSKPPVTFQQIIKASGPVSLP